MTKMTDKTAPQLTLSTPKASGKEVKVAQNIVLTFDEAIKSGTGHITINLSSR
jgi:hypothetical protein